MALSRLQLKHGQSGMRDCQSFARGAGREPAAPRGVQACCPTALMARRHDGGPNATRNGPLLVGPIKPLSLVGMFQPKLGRAFSFLEKGLRGRSAAPETHIINAARLGHVSNLVLAVGRGTGPKREGGQYLAGGSSHDPSLF